MEDGFRHDPAALNLSDPQAFQGEVPCQNAPEPDPNPESDARAERAAMHRGKRNAGEVTLADACGWMIEGRHFGNTANARNIASKLRYWRRSPFANWPISQIHDWDLILWQRDLLETSPRTPAMRQSRQEGCGPQTVIHRLNALSKLVTTWSRANRVALENPVKPGVRPAMPDGRTRRVLADEEQRLLDAAANSSRPWLVEAITIAIETAVRQAELVGLVWSRVHVDAARPYIDLPKTKNERPRRVPLSIRAVAAFRALRARHPAPAPGARVLPVATPRGIIHAFKAITQRNGFADLRWHDLRHEAISRLFELTDLRDNEIMAITGHLTPSMLTRYTHLRTDRLVDRLPGGRLNQTPAAL